MTTNTGPRGPTEKDPRTSTKVRGSGKTLLCGWNAPLR